MIGTRAMSGSAASRFRNVRIAATESSRPSSMLTSRIWAPPSTCWRAIVERLVVLAGEHELREARRARDVRALADVDEVRVRAGSRAGRGPRSGVSGATCGRTRGRDPAHGSGDRADVRRRRAAAAADEVHEPGLAPTRRGRAPSTRASRRSRRRRSAGRRSGRRSRTSGELRQLLDVRRASRAARARSSRPRRRAGRAAPRSRRPRRSGPRGCGPSRSVIVTEAITGRRRAALLEARARRPRAPPWR